MRDYERHFLRWVKRKIAMYISFIAVLNQVWNAMILNENFQDLSVDVNPNGHLLKNVVPANKRNNQELASIVFVTFSHLKDFTRFEKLIFPALSTFLKDETYFVVLSKRWRKKYYTKLCKFNQDYAAYCSRINPIFVDCHEDYFGPSPCCKQEKGLLKISKIRADADWLLYMDDDMYLRTWHLKKFLSQFDSSTSMIVTAGGKRAMSRALGQSSYSRFPLYKCSNSHNFTYPWGQPVMYSRAARETVKDGWNSGGLVSQCQEFKVSHDVGNAIFHWIYSLPVVNIRLFSHTTAESGKSFGTHGINHETAATRTGKKEIKDMYQMHNIFEQTYFNHVQPIIWHNATGFRSTNTYNMYGEPVTWGNVWHTMPYSDCWDPHDQLPPKNERLELLKQKCANILDRLKVDDTVSSIRIYEVPCQKVFELLNSPKTVSTLDIVSCENALAGFPSETPWQYFE
jgi:hypothetical protein